MFFDNFRKYENSERVFILLRTVSSLVIPLEKYHYAYGRSKYVGQESKYQSRLTDKILKDE